MRSPLAIHGGPRAVPEGTLQPSPPTTALDEEMVLQSLRSPQHAWGEQCEALQREWAAWNGNRHCVAVNSGTAALHMALVACGLSAGDEVITPAYSWTSSASCILHHNGIPVFVDVDPVFANLDPARIEAAITPRTRAILVVHLHGVPADMDPIMAIAARRGLAVVEDACQAHGALYKGRKVGTIGHGAAFSLNQNKVNDWRLPPSACERASATEAVDYRALGQQRCGLQERQVATLDLPSSGRAQPDVERFSTKPALQPGRVMLPRLRPGEGKSLAGFCC